MENNFRKLSDEKPDNGIEVICFNPAWIYEDFNPNGTRVGFLNGDNEFTTAHWWDYQDTYLTINRTECKDNPSYSGYIQDNTEPTHWCYMPDTSNLL